MCDYSLHFVASRPARVGDRLVSTRFRNSPTRGFAAIGEPDIRGDYFSGTFSGTLVGARSGAGAGVGAGV
jgi:hypothetical protein